MRIGAADAEFLEKQFTPVFTQQDLQNLPNYNAICAMLVNSVPARPFTLESTRSPALDYSRIQDLKELSYLTYGKPREEIEEEIRERFREKEPPPMKNPFNAYL